MRGFTGVANQCSFPFIEKSFKTAIAHNDLLKKEYIEHSALKTELDNIFFPSI